MVGVAEFDFEVVVPATVDGGVRDAVGLEFIGERHACAIDSEGIMRDGDTVDRHDAHQ